MATEADEQREKVWHLLTETQHYKMCPREVMGVLDALSVTSNVDLAHSELTYDETTGATKWTVIATTASALIQIQAAATREDKEIWDIGPHRGSVEYEVAPSVSADVRPLSDIERVELTTIGAAGAWQAGTQIVQTWTFALRGGTTIELRVDTGDRSQSEAVIGLCAQFSRQVTNRPGRLRRRAGPGQRPT